MQTETFPPETEAKPSPTALSIRAAISENGKRGEAALTALAKVEGDGIVEEIIGGLTPAEIVAVAIEHDMTTPSMVHAYTTPEQFECAFEKFGQRWHLLDEHICDEPEDDEPALDENNHPINDTGHTKPLFNIGYDLQERQRQLENFLCPMILSENTQRTRDMLEAFALQQLAAEALVFLGLERPHTERILENPLFGDVERNSYEELYGLTAEHHPELWVEVRELAESLDTQAKKVEFATEFCNGFHTNSEQTTNSEPEPVADNYLDI